jgi:hypothetical protein
MTTFIVCGGLFNVVVVVFAPPLVVFETVVVTDPSAFLVLVVVVVTLLVGVAATRVTLAFEGTESLKFAGGDVTTLVVLPGREVVDVVEAAEGIRGATGDAPDAPGLPGLWVHFATAGAATTSSVDAVRASQNRAREWDWNIALQTASRHELVRELRQRQSAVASGSISLTTTIVRRRILAKLGSQYLAGVGTILTISLQIARKLSQSPMRILIRPNMRASGDFDTEGPRFARKQRLLSHRHRLAA